MASYVIISQSLNITVRGTRSYHQSNRRDDSAVSSNYDKRKYRLARLNGLDPYTAANHATITKMKDCYVKGPRPTPNRLRKYESVAPPDYGESGKFSDFPYWEARRPQAVHLGQRGEYLVVSWLQSRNWFAKRSFGSRGVDVFAARGNRVLLIDVKSSRSESRSLEPVPKDPFVEAESVRTNIPAVRAAYTEGKTPRFFWYATGREIYPGRFAK